MRKIQLAKDSDSFLILQAKARVRRGEKRPQCGEKGKGRP